MQAMTARMRPYWLHAYLLAYTPIGLFADSRITALWQQWLLGGLTFAVLYLAALKAPREQRVQVWTCVAVATGFEIFGSLIWGVYRYRLHNLPLFVPPGHGIVYLFGLLAARTPVVLRHGRRVAYAVLAAAGAWAVAGLTVLPLVTGRLDVQGALCLPVFAYFLLRSPRWSLFAAVFIIVSELEISGTSFGDWMWLPVAPWTHIPSGNPPSVIAGGYCVIDGSVLLAIRVLARLGLQPFISTVATPSVVRLPSESSPHTSSST
ncbi:MAG: hypothetical protein ACHQ0J_12020 [Candidatus Dormibacterales bacterium]